jgi:hypothetical protein
MDKYKMKITLMKDHETPTAYYKAGETIEVSEAEYDWLMGIYLSERQVESEFVKEFDKKLEPLRKQK